MTEETVPGVADEVLSIDAYWADNAVEVRGNQRPIGALFGLRQGGPKPVQESRRAGGRDL
ncbi:hypothetical protein [Actinokineospora diospyrosa]|uniref:hypothetical protein n=1 Tax=Actinokineospora diospyrosa TaxID=103728 RepID=UPI0020A5975A|nr:hypothetical protein [Actinokineospora diospyrosa]